MDLIVRTVAKGIVPFIWVFGAYVVLHGHLTPGGSFSGGAIIAAGAVLLIISYGTKNAEKTIHEGNMHLIEAIAGALLVSLLAMEMFFRHEIHLLMIMLGLVNTSALLLLNIAGGLMVIAALIEVVYIFSRR